MFISNCMSKSSSLAEKYVPVDCICWKTCSTCTNKKRINENWIFKNDRPCHADLARCICGPKLSPLPSLIVSLLSNGLKTPHRHCTTLRAVCALHAKNNPFVHFRTNNVRPIAPWLHYISHIHKFLRSFPLQFSTSSPTHHPQVLTPPSSAPPIISSISLQRWLFQP